jgi:hypothetical protein
MKRADLINRRKKIDNIAESIAFLQSLPGTPKKLLERAYDNLNEEWVDLKRIIGWRTRIRNLKSRIKEREFAQDLAKEVEDGTK